MRDEGVIVIQVTVKKDEILLRDCPQEISDHEY
jgi:hypothetical protein